MKKKIVVIGGGLAGSLICNELVKHADVTLLEVGSKNAIQYPPISFVKKKLAEVSTFCFGGGGTTNLWHNGLIPINKGDVTNKDFGEMLAEAQLFSDEAASALFFNKESFPLAYEKLVSEVTDVAQSNRIFPDGIDCLIYPKKFKKLTVDSQVNDFYSVDKVSFVFDGSRIKTVTYTSASKEYSVEASIVIVAAGALGSPKIIREIILASGHLFDSQGAGFIDHPMGFVGKVRFKKDIAGFIRQLSMSDKGDYVSRSAIRLKSDCGQYTCCAFLRPALTMDNRLSIYKYKSLLGASTGLARLRNVFSCKLFHPDIIAEVFSHLFGVNIPSLTYNILFIAEQKRGNNRVYYDGDDLMVDWSISPDELAVYRSLLKKLNGMLQNIAEQVNIETNITEDWLWSAAHHSCTTPLGSAPSDLIDKDLKLNFCDNAFVCDGSVIQEHSYANTGLTIGQLAFRLVRRVLNVSG
ncbi:MAG: GMC oxidoreductase [Desulfuromonadaceae bacterium]|nr:GMC oxidoreductase [Desulfuromonadaceae bacterium]MDD2848977.1 GMC oxidoreductase [Desulfuromonadaceae bacterium]MDD4130326.1 GMC oxidoreductase [Desulfuromonadaceae bacterium]